MKRRANQNPKPDQRALYTIISKQQWRDLKFLAVYREVRMAVLVREALDQYLAKEQK